MKKALVIMNGTFVSQHIINAAVAVAKTSNSTLYAYFIAPDSTDPQFDYLFPNDLYLTQNFLTGKSIAEENKDLVKAHTQLFVDACKAQDVPYVLEQHNHISLRQLVAYSAFADFIMADARANLDQYRLGELLADAHCPVLLFSSAISRVKRVVFAYDGSFSSIYAIKMFNYIFPEWDQVETQLVYASPNGKDLPFKEEITTWISKHLKNSRIEILNGGVQEQLLEFIGQDNKDVIVVLGAYGRSNISRMFHRSFADYLIEKGQSALFVVHERH